MVIRIFVIEKGVDVKPVIVLKETRGGFDIIQFRLVASSWLN